MGNDVVRQVELAALVLDWQEGTGVPRRDVPTLDELIGRPDLGGVDPVDHLLELTAKDAGRDQVFTLHAELEGGAYLSSFERLLRTWRARGVQLTDLATYAGTLDVKKLPRCKIVAGSVAGRSGVLALQAS